MEISQARISSAARRASHAIRGRLRQRGDPHEQHERENPKHSHCARSHRWRSSTAEWCCPAPARCMTDPGARSRTWRPGLATVEPGPVSSVQRERSSVCCSVPIPLIAEPGMRHAMCRPLNLGVLPAPAAVGGYLHPANGSPTGPGQAADLVESAAGQLLSPGREGDDRFRSDLVIQRRDFRVLIKMPVVVVVHVVPVHQLDSPQILG